MNAKFIFFPGLLICIAQIVLGQGSYRHRDKDCIGNDIKGDPKEVVTIRCNWDEATGKIRPDEKEVLLFSYNGTQARLLNYSISFNYHSKRADTTLSSDKNEAYGYGSSGKLTVIKRTYFEFRDLMNTTCIVNKFDTHDNLLEKVVVERNGKGILYDSIREAYHYNDRNLLMEEDWFRFRNNSASPETFYGRTIVGIFKADTEGYSRTVYKYDGNDNLIKKNTFCSDSLFNQSVFIAYAANGRKIQEDRLLPEGESEKYIYDITGRVAEKKRLDSGCRLKTKFEFDKKRNIIKEQWYNKDGNTSWCYVYAYDQYNNKVQEMITGAADTAERSYTWEYVYDKYGNYVKKIELHNMKVFSEEYRSIKYY